MHEISLVQNLFSQLQQLAVENSKTKVTHVTMEIGPFSGVVTESFQFGFESLAINDNLVNGAHLEIQSPEVNYTCASCHHTEKTSHRQPKCCTKCGDLFLIPIGGQELVLLQVVME